MSTVRVDGLYQNGPLWFRFLPNNIAEARFIDDEPSPKKAAQRLARGNGGFGRGTYKVGGQSIEIDVKFPFGTNHYSGHVGKDVVKLTIVAKGTDHPAETYVFHPLTEDDLAPGLETRIHDLREQLKNKTFDVAVVEAAAALGDAVALSALHPPETKETAKRIAALGAQACVRTILAMCWAPDGLLYYPKQSEVTEADRKTDEGKVLRALAQWCVKPDEKSLTKIKAEFSEMERMGTDFEFMKLAVQTISAKTEAERAKAMNGILSLHIDEDVLLAYEAARDQVVPWLIGGEDPLAAKLKRIK